MSVSVCVNVWLHFIIIIFLFRRILVTVCLFCIVMEICWRSLFCQIKHNSKINNNKNNNNGNKQQKQNTLSMIFRIRMRMWLKWMFFLITSLPLFSSSLCVRFYVSFCSYLQHNMHIIMIFFYCLKFDAFVTNLFFVMLQFFLYRWNIYCFDFFVLTIQFTK